DLPLRRELRMGNRHGRNITTVMRRDIRVGIPARPGTPRDYNDALPPAAYRFGPFVVDRAAYRVVEKGQPLELTPKLLDLLLHLLDHAGTLVTKEALLDALWPGTSVTDNALAQAVSELRQALGDEAGDPRYIKTVARRGYRFVAAVEPVAPVEEPSIAEPTGEGADDLQSIAVLDFTSVTGDPESAWLSAGI